MDSNNLIISLVVIIFGIISRKYIEPIMPDQQKMYMLVKKTFAFIFRYLFPITIVIFEIIYSDFDKLFVLSVVILFSGLVLQLTLDWITSSSSVHFGIHKDKLALMKEMASEIEELKKEARIYTKKTSQE